MKKKLHPAASDHGTVLQPDQVAVVCGPNDGYQILLSDTDDEAEIPDKAVALVAAVMRLDEDEDFYEEMLAWFKERESPDNEEN